MHTLIEKFLDVVKLSIPLILARLLSMIIGFIGIVMLAHLGETVLSASALISASDHTLMLTSLSMLMSITILVGHAHGGGHDDQLAKIVQQGIMLGVLIGIGVVAVMWSMGPILHLFKQDPVLIPIVVSYFKSVLWGVIPFFVFLCLLSLVAGLMKKLIIFLFSALDLIVVLGCAYTLIFGKFGFPAMGAAGLGYAFAISAWLSMLLMLAYLHYHPELRKLELFRWQRSKRWSQLKKIIEVGWPITVQTTSELGSLFFITVLLGWLGAAALAVKQIVFQYLIIFVFVIQAISQAATILISNALGKHDYSGINYYAYCSLGFSLVITLAFFLVCWLMPDPLISLFIDIHKPENKEIIQLSREMFFVMGWGQFFNTGRNILVGALRGMFDTITPMWASFFSLWPLGAPLAYVMGFTWKMGIIGIVLAYNIAFAVGFVMIAWRWKNVSRRQIRSSQALN